MNRDPYIAIMVAAAKGQSLRLDAKECAMLAKDTFIEKVARSHLEREELAKPWRSIDPKADRPVAIAEWRAIPGYEEYEVSSLGQVRRGGRILKEVASGRYGHANVSIYAKGVERRVNVHKLIAEVFHGPAPDNKPFACHRNGHAWDNRADNLYWGSREENVADMIRHASLREKEFEKLVRKNAEN